MKKSKFSDRQIVGVLALGDLIDAETVMAQLASWPWTSMRIIFYIVPSRTRMLL
jgi:hypothetical protein